MNEQTPKSDANAAIERFETALRRIETAVEALEARRTAARDAAKLDRLAAGATPPPAPIEAAPHSEAAQTDAVAAGASQNETPASEPAAASAALGGPAADALRVAERELARLRRENDALRAAGAAAEDEATLKQFEAALARVAEDDAADGDASPSTNVGASG